MLFLPAACPSARPSTEVDQMGRSSATDAGIYEHAVGIEISKWAPRKVSVARGFRRDALKFGAA